MGGFHEGAIEKSSETLCARTKSESRLSAPNASEGSQTLELRH